MRFLTAKASQIRQGKQWLRSNSRIVSYTVMSTVLTLVAITSSVACARFYTIQTVNPGMYESQAETNLSTMITLEPTFIDIDATERTFTISWFARSAACAADVDVVDIYYEPCLTPSACQDLSQPEEATDSVIPSSGLPLIPVFRLNTTKSCISGTHDILALFKTATKMTGLFPFASLQAYPNDAYFAGVHLFAQSHSNNSSVGITMTENQWVSVNFNLKLYPLLLGRNDHGLAIGFDVARSVGLKVFVVAVIVTNWLVSVVFLWITVASIVWPEQVVKELFVIPITALFAFTSVRANLPGAPAGFGAKIDYIGILPNLILIMLSSATLLLVVLLRRIYQFSKGSNDLKSILPSISNTSLPLPTQGAHCCKVMMCCGHENRFPESVPICSKPTVVSADSQGPSSKPADIGTTQAPTGETSPEGPAMRSRIHHRTL